MRGELNPFQQIKSLPCDHYTTHPNKNYLLVFRCRGVFFSAILVTTSSTVVITGAVLLIKEMAASLSKQSFLSTSQKLHSPSMQGKREKQSFGEDNVDDDFNMQYMS